MYKHDICSGSVHMYIYNIYIYIYITLYCIPSFWPQQKTCVFCLGGIVLKKMCQRCMSNVRIMTCGL